ncbi:UDP-N-acetylmuramoyl-L-alanyl-D-glutamate--2,6-diaminopimelate ligase [Hydrogenophilus islandicus]
MSIPTSWPLTLDALFRECRERYPCAQLASDSRLIRPGDLFLAFPHDGRDGRAYLDDALDRGAAAVIAEAEALPNGVRGEAPIITRTELRQGGEAVPLWKVTGFTEWVGEWAHRWLGEPSAHLAVWGVTGTNGKTTVSQWLAQTLDRLGRPTGVVGTLGAGRIGALVPTGFTTPSAVLLHTLLSRFRAEGCSAASLEVSSIGVAERRIDGVRFRGAIFTNLTHDHLDYHGSTAAYAEAKRRFLFRPELRHQLFWIEDPLGGEWGVRAARDAAKEQLERTVWWVGSREQSERLLAALTPEEQRFVVTVTLTAKPQWQSGRWVVPVAVSRKAPLFPRTTAAETGVLQLAAAGDFQVANGLLVAAALLAEGFSLADALAALAEVSPPSGRMEWVADAPAVVVDYAHTPDALAQVLQSLRSLATARGGRLWVVFGAGGNRDAGKRPAMGEAAARYADAIIVTSDNPRWESPAAIAEAIRAGIPPTQSCAVMLDRAEAIDHAIGAAVPEDVIVIAGKGHETFQEIAGVKYPFSDQEVARRAMARRERVGERSDE